MMWSEWYDVEQRQDEEDESYERSHVNFDVFSMQSNPKDYYKILEVGYDASDEVIRSNYIRLALKWHPDKKKNEDSATSKFQEINEAYKVLSDPLKRHEYDKNGMLFSYDGNISEYLSLYKSLILTCNGLGMKCSIW
ncbi:chaperone protein dnaJ [Striga asiatica]|uniref:Chaperone protein dnaJ n=1 Tax=Striga asiatica TaxID=4170 RepID=A0A5A7RC85_STRAF|nr:chaperone protein dnaJ [Striga asiatica]